MHVVWHEWHNIHGLKIAQTHGTYNLGLCDQAYLSYVFLFKGEYNFPYALFQKKKYIGDVV
jgi:hypothetical protein